MGLLTDTVDKRINKIQKRQTIGNGYIYAGVGLLIVFAFYATFQFVKPQPSGQAAQQLAPLAATGNTSTGPGGSETRTTAPPLSSSAPSTTAVPGSDLVILPSADGSRSVYVSSSAVRAAQLAAKALVTGDLGSLPLGPDAQRPVRTGSWSDSALVTLSIAELSDNSTTFSVNVDPDGLNGPQVTQTHRVKLIQQNGSWAFGGV